MNHVGWLVGWLCLASHRQLGHLETAPSFTVPCEGHEARFLHRPHQESNPGSLRINEADHELLWLETLAAMILYNTKQWA